MGKTIDIDYQCFDDVSGLIDYLGNLSPRQADYATAVVNYMAGENRIDTPNPTNYNLSKVVAASIRDMLAGFANSSARLIPDEVSALVAPTTPTTPYKPPTPTPTAAPAPVDSLEPGERIPTPSDDYILCRVLMDALVVIMIVMAWFGWSWAVFIEGMVWIAFRVTLWHNTTSGKW